jgi:hypothetical protein
MLYSVDVESGGKPSALSDRGPVTSAFSADRSRQPMGAKNVSGRDPSFCVEKTFRLHALLSILVQGQKPKESQLKNAPQMFARLICLRRYLRCTA